MIKSRPFGVAAAAIGSFVLCACDLTQVSNPNTVYASSLDNPAGAVVRYNGALATFSEGFSMQTYESGLIADEFSDRSESQLEDKRDVTLNAGDSYPFAQLSLSRMDALHAIVSLQRYNPLPSERIGELWALLGYTELFFAENLCSGVPVGVLVNDAPAYGPTLSRQQLMQLALAQFDSALKYARPSLRTSADSATSLNIRDLALVGRARMLVDTGDLAGASTYASQVPMSFAYQPPFDTLLQSNAPFQYININQYASVSDNEGINGLPFVSAADPRVPTANIGVSSTDNLPIYAFVSYGGLGTPITLASGMEAQLIEAEAALHTGSPGGVNSWTAILNQLRQTASTVSMQPLTADSTTAASGSLRLAVMFRERAFWLFGTGHRQGDMRRLVRYYGQPVESVYPTGPYLSGTGTYGNSVVFLVIGESANPNFNGCLNLGL